MKGKQACMHFGNLNPKPEKVLIKANSLYLLTIMMIQLHKLTLEKLTFWIPLSSSAIFCHTHPWIHLNIMIHNHLMGVLRSFCVIITRKKSTSYMSTLDFIKANGPNGISTGMLKHTAASITPSITLILSLCIGRVPSEWKQSLVVPFLSQL